MTKKIFRLNCNESGGAQVGSTSNLRFSAHEMRPFRDEDGETFIRVNGENFPINVNANTTLPYQAWLDIDAMVVEVTKDRLMAMGDLISRGLTHNVGGLGTTVSQWEKESDMTAANESMNGETAGDEDGLNYAQDQVILPIIHKEFRIPMRSQLAVEQNGGDLEMSSVAVATRKVAEKSEDLLISGSSLNVGGSTVYGYTNYPNRNTFTISTAWTSITDYNDLLDDVLDMMTLARGDGYYGPYTLYIPDEYESVMDKSFDSSSGNPETVRDRILRINMIEAVKVVDRLATNNVVLVQMTRDVVDLAIAQTPIAVDWSLNGGISNHFKVFAGWAPRIKSTYDGDCGVVHGAV